MFNHSAKEIEAAFSGPKNAWEFDVDEKPRLSIRVRRASL
jgi:hypothetical protein